MYWNQSQFPIIAVVIIENASLFCDVNFGHIIWNMKAIIAEECYLHLGQSYLIEESYG